MIIRKSNILYVFAILSIFCCGLERIDFFQESGAIRLTPAFISACLFLAFYLLLSLNNLLNVEKKLYKHFCILILFLSIVFLSVLLSNDFGVSIKKFLLLFIYAINGLLSLSCVYKKAGKETIEVISKAMIFTSIINGIFILLDYLNFYGVFEINIIHKVFPFFQTEFARYGANLIRAKGVSGDPNRMSILMVCIVIVLLWNKNKNTFRHVVILLDIVAILLSISRTGYLCLAVCLFLFFFNSINFKKIKYSYLLYGTIILIIAAWITNIPYINSIIETVFIRFINGDASGSSHMSLIIDGINIAFSNIKIFLFGNGYQASANILYDYFQGSTYSNFHNAYISFFVESGIFSLVLFLAILIYPLSRNMKSLPLIACLMLGNISYQIYVEAYFWILLPLCLVIFEKNQGAYDEQNSLYCNDKLQNS